MKQCIAFNLNDEVSVKLMPRGVAILAEHCKDMQAHFTNIMASGYEDGYIKMQAHEFMLVFGQYMYTGMAVNEIISTTIYIHPSL